MTELKTLRLAFFSSPPWSVAGMLLTQQHADTASGQDMLFLGEALFVITTPDLEDTPFHSSP
ncbi:unnamed protein product, partial [Gulo gulo]